MNRERGGFYKSPARPAWGARRALDRGSWLRPGGRAEVQPVRSSSGAAVQLVGRSGPEAGW